MYLISDNVDTLTGMRLAGVDGVVVHERQELKNAIETAMNDKSVGIILLTEKFGTIDSEWHYGLIEPAILVENFVADSNGELNDYKFFCMNGRLEYFWIDYDRYGPNPSRAIFDRDKRRINMTLYKPDYKGDIKMPAEIDHMMALAEKLSKDFKCVRVDLYNVDGRIYFGELTFFSGDLIFHPRKYNRVWGDKLDI